MTKHDIQPLDKVIFRNGSSTIVSACQLAKIDMLYNVDLSSKMNPAYDIVEVKRPEFYSVYKNEEQLETPKIRVLRPHHATKRVVNG